MLGEAARRESNSTLLFARDFKVSLLSDYSVCINSNNLKLYLDELTERMDRLLLNPVVAQNQNDGAFSIYQKIPENSRNVVGKCLSAKDVFHLTHSSHSSQAPFTVRCISRQNTKWRHNCYCLTNARLLFRRSGSLKFR